MLLSLCRSDVWKHIFEAAPPPPWTIIWVLCVWIAFPVSRVCRNKLSTTLEVDERHIFYTFLKEFYMQLIRFLTFRICICQFTDNLRSPFVIPTQSLSGTSLTKRFDQRIIKSTDCRIEIFQDTTGWPVTCDIVVTLSAVYIPCCRRFGCDGTLESKCL